MESYQFPPVGVPAGDGSAPSAQLAAVRTSRFGLSGSLYNRVVQVVLAVVTVLVSLWYLPWTSSVLEYNKSLLLVVAASVGLITWLLGVVVSGKLTVRVTPLDKGVFAVLIAAIASAIFSRLSSVSVFGTSASMSSALVVTIALAVLYFLAVNAVHDRGRALRTLLMVSVSLALVIGLFQMFTWYFLPGGFTHSRAFNTVGSLNALGILAAIMLPMLTKSTLQSRRMLAVLAIAGIVLCMSVLAILNWWVLWVVALAGMLAMIAFDSVNVTQLASDYGKSSRFSLARFIVPMAVVVIGAFLMLVQFNVSSLKSQFPVEVAPSYKLSSSIAVRALRQDPMFGWGQELFTLAFDKFGASQLASTQLSSLRFMDATSEFLTYAVQYGAVGILALLLLGWSLVQVAARFGSAISDTIARGENALWAKQSSGTLAALAAALVAFLLYPFSITLLFVLVALLAMAGLAVSGQSSRTVDLEARPLYSLSASLGFIVGLVLVLSGVYFCSVRYLGDVRYASALQQSSPDRAMDGLVKAVDLNGSNDRYYRDASQLALAMLREEVAKGKDADATRVQNLMASAIQLAQRAAQVNDQESLNWANLGDVYQSLTGMVENVEKLAEDSFRKAGELRVGDPTFDNRIGQMWLSRADLMRSVAQGSKKLDTQIAESLQNAEAAFKMAIEKSSTFGLAIYNLGAVYDRQNNVNEAIKQLEKIAPYNANQPTLMFELGLLYIRAEKKDLALQAMQRAVLLAPQYANARWYVALLLEDKGETEAALANLREIQKSNGDNDALRQKISQLEGGAQPSPAEVIDNKPLE